MYRWAKEHVSCYAGTCCPRDRKEILEIANAELDDINRVLFLSNDVPDPFCAASPDIFHHFASHDWVATVTMVKTVVTMVKTVVTMVKTMVIVVKTMVTMVKTMVTMVKTVVTIVKTVVTVVKTMHCNYNFCYPLFLLHKFRLFGQICTNLIC